MAKAGDVYNAKQKMLIEFKQMCESVKKDYSDEVNKNLLAKILLWVFWLSMIFTIAWLIKMYYN